jgi:very-short-patch-repair endonuclease
MSLQQLQQIGRRQLGLVTRADVSRHLDDAERRTALRRGWLIPFRPGVLVFAGAARSWHQGVLATVLGAGPSAVASHGTAAALWELPGFPQNSRTSLEVTVPRGRRPRARGATLHTTQLLEPQHRTVRDGIPVTSAVRTVCDLDGRVDERRLGEIVDELLVRGIVTVARLREAHGALARGPRPSRTLGLLLAERGPEWDDADSRREARLVDWLVAAGLPRPVQQHVVGRYEIDLAYPEQRVFIEYDGFAGHGTRTRFDRDRRRDNTLQLSEGAIVLRYTSRSTREQVVREVTAALRGAGCRPADRATGPAPCSP